MTVIISPGRLSWWCTAPVIVVLGGLLAVFWIIPVPACYEGLSTTSLFVAKVLTTVFVLVGIFMIIAWTVWGGDEDNYY